MLNLDMCFSFLMMENHVGEKLITVLIALGAARFQRDRSVASLDRYVERIQHLVQHHILGAAIQPKQWKFPLKNDGKEVCNI
jgi:hypothetical protein